MNPILGLFGLTGIENLYGLLALVGLVVAAGSFWTGRPLLGSGMSGVAALGTGALLMGGIGLEEAMFLVIVGTTVSGAVFAVTADRTFHSAMGLGLALISIAALYISLQQALLGVIQVLVYVGGILTLLVFAVMFVASDEEEEPEVGL